MVTINPQASNLTNLIKTTDFNTTKIQTGAVETGETQPKTTTESNSQKTEIGQMFYSDSRYSLSCPKRTSPTDGQNIDYVA